ncbi:hypothetical protein DEJ07_16850, partial [Curtobacterium sp. MCLR17_053]
MRTVGSRGPRARLRGALQCHSATRDPARYVARLWLRADAERQGRCRTTPTRSPVARADGCRRVRTTRSMSDDVDGVVPHRPARAR